MSNEEVNPDQVVCHAGGLPGPQCEQRDGVPVEIISARQVPLGGPRSMIVSRTIPQRQRSLIGPWCFVDHYGPEDVSVSGGMDVAPHPHTGLQTVSWLFEGTIQHVDSGGSQGLVKPGEVNLMTAGRGICHSEVSTDDTHTLHGVQLWLAMPDADRHETTRRFEHYEPELCTFDGGSALVFLGELLGSTSPVHAYSPVLGAELRIDPNATVCISVNPEFEHGFLMDSENVSVEGVPVPHRSIGYTGVGASTITLHNHSDEPARLIMLGGTPFGEEIVMWWNFVGRSHQEIEQFRHEWQNHSEQFGEVQGYVGKGENGANVHGLTRLPAPELPNVNIRARKNAPPHAQTSD